MDVEAVIARINNLLVHEFEIEAERVVSSASLRDDLDFDSLDGLDLVVALEKEFGLRVSDEVMMRMQTVGDIHAYVHAVWAERQQKGG